jgi:hypothetical protein
MDAIVNSALVYVLRVRKREIKLCQREGERRTYIFSLDPLPSNSLVYFIDFYWLIFNKFHFLYFILLLFLFCLCVLFYYFCSFSFYFVMVIAMSIHLIDMPLDEESKGSRVVGVDGLVWVGWMVWLADMVGWLDGGMDIRLLNLDC